MVIFGLAPFGPFDTSAAADAVAATQGPFGLTSLGLYSVGMLGFRGHLMTLFELTDFLLGSRLNRALSTHHSLGDGGRIEEPYTFSVSHETLT